MARRLKILFTGMTAAHLDSPRCLLKFASQQQFYAAALRELGHVVEFRAVTPGEALKEYDRVVVGITALNKISARYVLGGVWALRQILRGECRGFAYLEDWQVGACFSGFRLLAKSDHHFYKPMPEREHCQMVLNSLRLRDSIRVAVEMLAERFTIQVLFGLTDGGDAGLLTKKTPLDSQCVLRVDPTAYYPFDELRNVSFVLDEKRERAWVLGSLSDQRRWLADHSFKWPVETYGHKEHMHPKVPESKLLRRYAETWGVLAHPYYHAGSGWYRNRFVHAYALGCVTYCDPRDGAVFGDPYLVPLETIERMGNKRLGDLVNDQRACFKRKMWTKDRVKQELQRIVTKEC